MAAPTKTATTTVLLPMSSIVNNSGAEGAILDVSGAHLLGVYAEMGRADATAHTSPFAKLLILGSPVASGSSTFSVLQTLQMPAGASIAQTALSSAVSAGATTLAVVSATNIAVGALLMVGDASLTKYEVVRVMSISGTTLTVQRPFEFDHTSGAIVSSQAEQIATTVDVSAMWRVLVRVENGSGRQVFARASGLLTVL